MDETINYEVIEMPSALRDLDAILAYIADDLQSPAAAADLLDAYDEAVQSLCFFPHRCPQPKAKGLKQYRILQCHNYLIFYIVKEEVKVVEIRRIFYNKQDYQFLLTKE